MVVVVVVTAAEECGVATTRVLTFLRLLLVEEQAMHTHTHTGMHTKRNMTPATTTPMMMDTTLVLPACMQQTVRKSQVQGVRTSGWGGGDIDIRYFGPHTFYMTI